jgi:predicted MFS family arabinose efflux permease
LALTGLTFVLSLGPAVALGVTRFAYGLLLPTMRSDLNWSYALAGGMNTANALGYLLGALASPRLLRRFEPGALLVVGSLFASVLMVSCGFFLDPLALLVLRLLAGVASAVVFVTGGLMAARLGATAPSQMGWLLGVFYGGTGLGISASALLVPWVADLAVGQLHAWRWAWWALGLLSALASLVLVWPARVVAQVMEQQAGQAVQSAHTLKLDGRPLAFGLAGYLAFGVGYIGYMTFVIALLRELGVAPERITGFYTLLGLAVVVSSRLWAGLLDRARGGGALATLNALLGLAALLPALSTWWPMLLFSGVMFGGVFLSVVASTTALVRHNLPAGQWAAGISFFTLVFAAGQIVGPVVVGWIADGAGGLARGLVFSAAALWVGALLAWRQRPLKAC